MRVHKGNRRKSWTTKPHPVPLVVLCILCHATSPDPPVRKYLLSCYKFALIAQVETRLLLHALVAYRLFWDGMEKGIPER